MAHEQVPSRAKIVIIGGGVGGTSVAYHLTQLGERDVILLDRADLTSGSTFHSAGLVGQLRGRGQDRLERRRGEQDRHLQSGSACEVP